MGNNQYIVPIENGWDIRGKSNARLTSIFDRQPDAIAAVR